MISAILLFSNPAKNLKSKLTMRILKTLWLPISLALLLVLPLAAQDLKLKSGALDFLKGEKTLNVEYDYAGLSVGKLIDWKSKKQTRKVAESLPCELDWWR